MKKSITRRNFLAGAGLTLAGGHAGGVPIFFRAEDRHSF